MPPISRRMALYGLTTPNENSVKALERRGVVGGAFIPEVATSNT